MSIFDAYIRKGLLKKQQVDLAQIARQLARSHKDLATLTLLQETDPQWAATIAYQAMLRAGRALLFANGVLPTDGQQHKTVVQITGKILGSKYRRLVEQFERLRRKRNVFFYDSEESATASETASAIAAARELLGVICTRIREANPQTSFDF